MQTYNYYTLTAVNTDGDQEGLFGSYIRDEVQDELNDERDNFKAAGFRKFKIETSTTTEAPSFDVYPELYSDDDEESEYNLEMTREEWLTEAAQFILDDILAPHHNQPAPPIRISVGFPKGRAGKAIAQCFKRRVSTDQHNEIFVSPLIDTPLEILAALTHELIHALDDCASGHKAFFAMTARKAGLQGKLTATYASPELNSQLKEIIDTLPPFPYAKMDISSVPKQATRMKKAQCTNCAFTFRLTKTAISQVTDNYCVACQNETMQYDV